MSEEKLCVLFGVQVLQYCEPLLVFTPNRTVMHSPGVPSLNQYIQTGDKNKKLTILITNHFLSVTDEQSVVVSRQYIKLRFLLPKSLNIMIPVPTHFVYSMLNMQENVHLSSCISLFLDQSDAASVQHYAACLVSDS